MTSLCKIVLNLYLIVVIKINNGELTDFEKDFLSKQYFANEINLKQGIEIILENYGYFRKIVRKEEKRRMDIGFKPERIQFDDHYKKNLLTNLIYRGLSKNCIRKIIDETDLKNKFSSKGSKRNTNLTITPFLSIKENNANILETNINLPKDYYITYLFRTDMSGVYLTLMWGADEVKEYQNKNDFIFVKRSQDSIIKKYEYITGNKFDFNKFSTAPIDLKCGQSYSCNDEKKYEEGVIFSKFYHKDNIPSNDILSNDLKDYLKLYDLCLDNDMVPTMRFDSIEEMVNMVYDVFKEIYANYEDEKNKPFEENVFLKDINNNFYDSFHQYVSELVDPMYNAKFDAEIDFGKNNWNTYPIINIYYDKLSNTDSKGLYIYSLLDTSNKKLEFGLKLDETKFNHVSNKSLIKYLFNYLIDNDIQLIESENRIVLDNVDFELLDDKLLKKEFEAVIKKFESLINVYICYVFEKEIKGSVNVHDNDSLNINFKDLEDELPEDFEIDQKKIKEICSAFNSNNIILKGVPGTGKTLIAEHLASLGSKNKFVDGYLLTTATSDWSTFDTMGGLIPIEDGKLVFKPGKFLEAIELNKWLIIDEINRADIDKAFGQLFTVLSGYDVELPYKDSEGNPIKIIRDKYSNKSYHDPVSGNYVIGNNWRIIGTMNTIDKDTLYDLSYAFMRRFMFVDIDVPHYNDELKEKWINKYFVENIDENYLNEIKCVWEISSSREFGPAIYEDLLKYMHERVEMDNLILEFHSENPDDDEIKESLYSIMASGINAYIIPQIEGLSDNGEVKDKIKKYFAAYYKDNPSVDEKKLDEILDNLLNSHLIL